MSVLYTELRPDEFRKRIEKAPIAYLPLGTLEWHGEHLPLGTDGILSENFFQKLAKEVGGIVLPMLFLGPDEQRVSGDQELYGMDFRGTSLDAKHFYEGMQLGGSCYWVLDETFQTILDATLKQLQRAGFRIVVAHGHGPSTHFFQKMIPTWKETYDLPCFTCWGSVYDEDGLGLMVDHAAMNETSLMMTIRKELAQMDRLPEDLKIYPVGLEGKDPRVHAGEELGQKIVTLQLERMKNILFEMLKN